MARSGTSCRTCGTSTAIGGFRISSWTVAELAAHLASLPRWYRAQEELGDSFMPPEDWARFSIEQRSHIDTTDPPGRGPPSWSPRSSASWMSWTGWTISTACAGSTVGRPTHRNVAAGLLSELVVHGQDLGRLTGNRPELTRRQANAVLPAMMAILPAFVNPAKASRAAGVYHLRFRGGDDWTYRIGEDGSFAVDRGRPDRCDAHLWADPAAFILVGLGRRHPIPAALTGKMVVWGRRPWKLAATGDIAVEGI